ncbi:DUF4352 domain-containing protein [Jeotgalibacillus haloalkalitolerans]|uniref:DUF4352 domain-containing protein n=1 Tax=Jeotgalibacillus haloalkalitolerans TaxID=3104292 RepID=A0ABU5KHH1_9BACL|nr:DUF4352 domain-containing protein [Jeotgalibacillus sp. HH7-29]MDZ5710642.1 DUF4352 domain-containing protein [Jeotgalibacillus sp. HH7-29]
MKKSMFWLLLIVSMLLVACGDDSTSGEDILEPETAEAETENSESGEEEEVSNEDSKGILAEEDYDKLYTNPGDYKGYEVEMTGKVFMEPEKDGDGTYFQMWADPENSEKNTIIGIDDPSLDLSSEDYVKIKGVVHDEFEGENAFGGIVTAPMVAAESVEVVDYITAMSPTLKEISPAQEMNQHDLMITVQKVEFAENQTRVYVKVQNNTQDLASFYTHSARLIVGNQQLESDYFDSYSTGLPEVQSDILPGIESEGVIVYPAIDFEATESMQFYAETYSDNYELDFEPYIFDIVIE